MALLSGAGAIMVALIMVGSASAASVNTVHAPYKGLVAPYDSAYASGCASSAKDTKKSKFDLKTGVGTAAFTGKAGNCGKKLPKGFYSSSYANAGAGWEAVIELPHVSATTTNISANLAGKYTWTANVNTGSKAGACPGAAILNYYWYNYTEWEWGFNASTYSFAGYAYNDTYYGYDGTWYSYNSSYNTASIPSPFNLNSTTFYYTDYGSSVYSEFECYADVGGSIYTYMEICDTTANWCYYMTGGTLAYDEFWSIDIANYTDYEGPYGYTYWYGPSSYSFGYAYPGYSYNQSGISWYFYKYYLMSPYFNYTSGSAPSASSYTLSQSTSLTGQSLWVNQSYYPYSPTDKVYAIWEFEPSMYADNSNWAKGSATFAFNGATLGNGVKLASITES